MKTLNLNIVLLSTLVSASAMANNSVGPQNASFDDVLPGQQSAKSFVAPVADTDTAQKASNIAAPEDTSADAKEAAAPQTWSQWGWDYMSSAASTAASAATSAAKAAGNYTLESAYEVGKWGLAANLNYMAKPVISEVTALGVGGIAGAAAVVLAGPAAMVPAAKTAYGATKATLTAADYVAPWAHGALAAGYASATKALVVEPAIKAAPYVANAVYNGASVAADYATQAAKGAYGYFASAE